MAHINYDKLWRSEFYHNVSAKDRDQGINLNQLKLKVNNTYEKNEIISLNFETGIDENVVNKTLFYIPKLSKIEDQISYIEIDHNEYKIHNNKKNAEEIVIERASKTTIEIF